MIEKFKEFIDSYRPLVPWLIALILAVMMVVDKYDVRVVWSSDDNGNCIVGISYCKNRPNDTPPIDPPVPVVVPPPIDPPTPTPYDLRPDILKAESRNDDRFELMMNALESLEKKVDSIPTWN